MKIDPATTAGKTSGSTTDRKVRPAARAEVGRRLEQRVRQPVQPGVDRQDHERQPQVGQHQDGRRQAVAGPCARTAADPVDDAAVASMTRHAYALTR